MLWIDIVVVLLLLVWAGYAVYKIVKRKGGCGCGCSGCTKNCSKRK